MQIYKTSKARENILGKIRKQLSVAGARVPYPELENDNSALYVSSDMAVEECFAMAFTSLGGKFVFCENDRELVQQLATLQDTCGWEKVFCADPEMLHSLRNCGLDQLQSADPADGSADACITGCEMLVARTGSVLLSSGQNLGRTASVYYPVHIVVAFADQIVSDLDDAFAAMKKKYGNDLPSMISLATGPSRTADIEKTLVVGVHGPCEVFCFFVNRES